MENVKYYVNLITPYKDKYGRIISTKNKISVLTVHFKEYIYFGKCDEEFLNKFTHEFIELDYVKNYHKVLIQYGHGSGEFELVPCKLFKEVTISKKK